MTLYTSSINQILSGGMVYWLTQWETSLGVGSQHLIQSLLSNIEPALLIILLPMKIKSYHNPLLQKPILHLLRRLQSLIPSHLLQIHNLQLHSIVMLIMSYLILLGDNRCDQNRNHTAFLTHITFPQDRNRGRI